MRHGILFICPCIQFNCSFTPTRLCLYFSNMSPYLRLFFSNLTFEILAGAGKKNGQTVDFPKTTLCYYEKKNEAQPIGSKLSDYKKLVITTTRINHCRRPLPLSLSPLPLYRRCRRQLCRCRLCRLHLRCRSCIRLPNPRCSVRRGC